MTQSTCPRCGKVAIYESIVVCRPPDFKPILLERLRCRSRDYTKMRESRGCCPYIVLKETPLEEP